MYHISIYLSVDGRLGCFHVLAIVKSAAITTGVHVSFWIMIFLGYMPRSRIVSSSVQFSHLIVSDSLWPCELQHTRLPCPITNSQSCSNSCPSSQWCHPTISSILCHPFLLPSIFPSIRFSSNKSVLLIRWPRYWSFSFSTSPSNEYSGLISFRIDWFDLLAVKGTLKSLLQHHSSKASIF